MRELPGFDIIKKIGTSDPSYFIICDDTDYAIKVQDYTPIVFVTNAILHRQLATKSTSDKSVTDDFDWKMYYSIRNSILFMKKNGKTWRARYINIPVNFFYWNLRAIKSLSLKNIYVVNKAMLDGILNKKGRTVLPGAF